MTEEERDQQREELIEELGFDPFEEIGVTTVTFDRTSLEQWAAALRRSAPEFDEVEQEVEASAQKLEDILDRHLDGTADLDFSVTRVSVDEQTMRDTLELLDRMMQAEGWGDAPGDVQATLTSAAAELDARMPPD